MRRRVAAFIFLGSLGLFTVILAACGGGSSSNTGPSAGGGGGFSGGSGAVIQGQLVRGRSAALDESRVMVVLRTALGIGLAEAVVGDPISGATVELHAFPGGSLVGTTTTTSTGNFSFQSVAPGSYTIVVVGQTLDATSDGTATDPIIVGDGDSGTIVGTVTDTGIILTVHVAAGDSLDIVHNAAQLCHAASIANASGRDIGDVVAARQAHGGGHGWGNIALQFGVSPSVLGDHCSETQISDAAAVVGAGGNGNGKGKGNSNGNGNGNGNAKGKGKA
jgi:Carboxypeptidase regulatory-like domain